MTAGLHAMAAILAAPMEPNCTTERWLVVLVPEILQEAGAVAVLVQTGRVVAGLPRKV